MADMRSKLNELYSLEQLAAGSTAVHMLHPAAKIIVTITYIICVISLERHSLGRFAPFFLYPVIIMALAEVPLRLILPRAAAALPFCVFAGISNLLMERAALLYIGALGVSAGAMSFLVLLARTLLCVSAVLILVAVTPFSDLTDQLRRMHVPVFFVMLIEMIYRYIGVLAEEASSMLTAYRLRSGGARWPDIKYFGAFTGQLLLRSADRAERVYHAMQCRGYMAPHAVKTRRRFTYMDWIFMAAGCGTSVLFSAVDLPYTIGSMIIGAAV